MALLCAACPRPTPPVDTEGVDAAGLSFDQIFGANEGFEDGGVMEGAGTLYLSLHVAEGALDGQVFSGGGDITVDGRAVPEGQALPIEGSAWWEDDGRVCFALWFYAPAADALEARAVACRTENWIDVEVGGEDAVEESLFMTAGWPRDDFFTASSRSAQE